MKTEYKAVGQRSLPQSPTSSRVLISLPSIPPSTITTWPVTWLDTVGDANTKIWFATSKGVATFLSGVLEISNQNHPQTHASAEEALTLPVLCKLPPGSPVTL